MCIRDRVEHVTTSTATGERSTRRLLLAYLWAQIDELRSREPGARIDSPDAVHRMRVASRRLRSSLATFRPLFKGSKAPRRRCAFEPLKSGRNVARLLRSRRDATRIRWTASGLSMRAPGSRDRSSSIWAHRYARSSRRVLRSPVAVLVVTCSTYVPATSAAGGSGRAGCPDTNVAIRSDPCALLPTSSIMDVTD